jgi:hypothetical protein
MPRSSRATAPSSCGRSTVIVSRAVMDAPRGMREGDDLVTVLEPEQATPSSARSNAASSPERTASSTRWRSYEWEGETREAAERQTFGNE